MYEIPGITIHYLDFQLPETFLLDLQKLFSVYFSAMLSHFPFVLEYNYGNNCSFVPFSMLSLVILHGHEEYILESGEKSCHAQATRFYRADCGVATQNL